ncbi:hypothetical protein GobsT_06500 [Gemmata obscuriglobus]|nr:hypothetical protein GobsT_06500 [Gemmata obscuriglobus]VTS00025.1 unnamed protein product [Gemmata obscuriglobus UQM 2246]
MDEIEGFQSLAEWTHRLAHGPRGRERSADLAEHAEISSRIGRGGGLENVAPAKRPARDHLAPRGASVVSRTTHVGTE